MEEMTFLAETAHVKLRRRRKYRYLSIYAPTPPLPNSSQLLQVGKNVRLGEGLVCSCSDTVIDLN